MSKKSRAEKKEKFASASDRLAFRKGVGERTAIAVPEGVSFFGPKKEGTWKIEVIPYKVGKRNPNKKVEKGSYYYELTYFIHPRIGADNNSYCCLQRTFGKKCPVCEHRIKLEKSAESEEEKKLVKSLYPKERQLFNIFDHGEPEKGVQIFEISFHNFGKHLDKKIRTADDEDRERLNQFFHPTKGRTLRITGSEESMGKQKYIEFSDIEFKKRSEPLDEALLEEAVDLESLPIELEYDELKKIFLQSGDDEDDDEDDDDKPKKKKKAKDDDEEDDEDDAEEDEDGDEDADDEDEWSKGDSVDFVYRGKRMNGKIKRLNRKRGLAEIKVPGQERLSVIDIDELMKPKKKGKKQEDEEEDEEEDDWDDADDDDDEDDDEDDEPKPKKKSKKKKKKAEDDDDDDDDADDDDDDDDD